MTVTQNTITQTTVVQNIIKQLPHRLENYFFAQSKRQAVIKNALITVANRHPDWADVGFDEHFVKNQGAATMAGYFQSGQLPNAAALAEAWSNQFHWQSTTKLSAQERFMPIAEDFVYQLESAQRQVQSTSGQPQQVESPTFSTKLTTV